MACWLKASKKVWGDACTPWKLKMPRHFLSPKENAFLSGNLDIMCSWPETWTWTSSEREVLRWPVKLLTANVTLWGRSIGRKAGVWQKKKEIQHMLRQVNGVTIEMVAGKLEKSIATPKKIKIFHCFWKKISSCLKEIIKYWAKKI